MVTTNEQCSKFQQMILTFSKGTFFNIHGELKIIIKLLYEDGLPERMIFEALPEPSIKELLFDTGNCYSNNKFFFMASW